MTYDPEAASEERFVREGGSAAARLLRRVAAIEARQRAAGQHDPGCGRDQVVGDVRVSVYRSADVPGTVRYASMIHQESRGETGEAHIEWDGPDADLKALAGERLKDKLRGTEWFRPCTCWLSEGER